jgi:hypothetical protein
VVYFLMRSYLLGGWYEFTEKNGRSSAVFFGGLPAPP